MVPAKSTRWLLLSGLLVLSLALSACQAAGLPELSSLRQIVRSVQTPAAPAANSSAAPSSTAPAEEAAAPDAAPAAAASAPPVALAISGINLSAEVTPMGWELAMNGDQVTTRWVVPLDTLGWAVNSAEAGAPGNMVILGHQALGAALLRPMALGDIAVGQEIRVQAANGATYLYKVSEVSPPIPAIGASAEDRATAEAYLSPGGDARLTLVSGWPADTTTHRLFVVAGYIGQAP